MLFKLIFVIILQLQLVEFGLSYRHDSYRDDHRYRPSRQSNKRRHHTPGSRVLMPSGNSYYITAPLTDTRRAKCGQKSKLVDLDPNSKRGKKEFHIVKKEVESMWGSGYAGHDVTKVQKIVNACLWKKYQYRKFEVVREARTANERMLFHGSKSVLDIMNGGFDERHARITGTFGAGVYFASKPSLSHLFTTVQADGTRLLLLCRVAMGKVHILHSGNQLAHAPPGYQSVMGDINPPEFIVYRGEQAYPEYLITYK